MCAAAASAATTATTAAVINCTIGPDDQHKGALLSFVNDVSVYEVYKQITQQSNKLSP